MTPDALPGKLLVPQPTLDDFPDFVSIPIRIAHHAKAFPDKRAVVCEGKARTWREFDRRVNRIARTLASRKASRNARVTWRALISAEPESGLVAPPPWTIRPVP